MRHLLLISFKRKNKRNLRKFFFSLIGLIFYNVVILDFMQFNFHSIAFSIYLPPTLCRVIAPDLSPLKS